MAASLERSRGDRWATLLRTQGWWVQKMPASSTSGVPDWLRGHAYYGLVWTEAKTLEAVERARGQLPRNACTTAQRFWLDQVVRYGGRASLLVLEEERWMDLEWTLEGEGQGPGERLWMPYLGAA